MSSRGFCICRGGPTANSSLKADLLTNAIGWEARFDRVRMTNDFNFLTSTAVLVEGIFYRQGGESGAAALVGPQPDSKFCPLRCSEDTKCATGVSKGGVLDARERGSQHPFG